MAGNAYIGIEVLCGVPNKPGLDGHKDAVFVFSFEFPDGESAEFRIPVVAEKNKKKKPGGDQPPGDTGVDIVNRAKKAVQDAVRAGTLSARNAKKIGFQTKVVEKAGGGRGRDAAGGGPRGGGGGGGGAAARPGAGGDTKDYLGRISFHAVSSIDAACTNGKVKTRGFVNNPPKGVAPLPFGENKGVEFKEPPKPPKGESWEDKLKKKSTQKSEWKKFVESGDWGPVGWGHHIIRVADDDTGVVLEDPDEGGTGFIRVPFPYVHESPRAQVRAIAQRLALAGFECAVGDTWIQPRWHIPSGLPVVGYGIETAEDPFDAYGPLPWHVVIGDIRKTSPGVIIDAAQESLTLEPAVPASAGRRVDPDELTQRLDGSTRSERAAPERPSRRERDRLVE
jgi:hypothetical protein